MYKTKVVTYAQVGTAGLRINLTGPQMEALRQAKLWPHRACGGSYDGLWKGWHISYVTFTDAELQLLISDGGDACRALDAAAKRWLDFVTGNG